jgi:hypothetical protein
MTHDLIDGVILLWFIEVALFATWVAIDIQWTPESPVMKWGFVIMTLYTGPFGALLYAISCREPLPGTHQAFVAARWKQVVGSTMHCVAGDGIGILAAATVTAALKLPLGLHLIPEYLLGFLFGWTIFQALFMKDMVGGSYRRSLAATFLPELLSMNGVMAGMAAVMVPWMTRDPLAMEPTSPRFWFTMSIALTAGFLIAYPINWWLVERGLKHGMMTVRPSGKPVPHAAGLVLAGEALRLSLAVRPLESSAASMSGVSSMPDISQSAQHRTTSGELARMTVLTFIVLAAGIAVVGIAGNLSMRPG